MSESVCACFYFLFPCFVYGLPPIALEKLFWHLISLLCLQVATRCARGISVRRVWPEPTQIDIQFLKIHQRLVIEVALGTVCMILPPSLKRLAMASLSDFMFVFGPKSTHSETQFSKYSKV